ncbi:N-acetylmuramoyl-L-alanine amidase [bacterium]|nr:N-acetylmuramoyl-L-alanine amidase [candidate division CSSED10-310 bacterium]
MSVFLFTAYVLTATALAASRPAVTQIDKTLTVIMLEREIYIEITASPKNLADAVMSDLVIAGSRSNKQFLVKKGFRSKTPVYRMPWDHLTCEGKNRAIGVLFPRDRHVSGDWEHYVTHGGSHGETLWRISYWFTGSGTAAKSLAKTNKLNPQKLATGDKVLISKELLQECFSERLQYPIVVDELTFRKDETGEYAEYVLLAGQTIYSWVLKYTPRVTADDVLAASTLILQRSGLRDFRSIPSNTVLRIPSDIISPQFLPPADPRRIQFEATDRESSLFKPQEKAKALEGITVILDSGHGGVDPGSIGKGGVKEDEYAYDVMCRVKRILEKGTKAKVLVTIEDEETSFKPRDSRLLGSGNNKEKILTTPPYLIDDTRDALNLRWILTNYLYTHEHPANSRYERVVFTSFHADCLHPSAHGLMVYIPGADYYSGNIKKTDKVLLRRKEAGSGGNKVANTRRDRLQAEGFSNAFALKIRDMCNQHHISMHSNQPIRKYVIRNRRSWVPALLRYCKIPTRVLIELANLQNPGDVQRMMDPEYRESLAVMYVNALKSHFAE